jgi:hypothetical protein
MSKKPELKPEDTDFTRGCGSLNLFPMIETDLPSEEAQPNETKLEIDKTGNPASKTPFTKFMFDDKGSGRFG